MKSKNVNVSSSVLKDDNGDKLKWVIDVALPETIAEAVDCYGEADLLSMANELFATKEANRSRQAAVAKATGKTTVSRATLKSLLATLPEATQQAAVDAINAGDTSALAALLVADDAEPTEAVSADAPTE